jgi:hypothetical protein
MSPTGPLTGEEPPASWLELFLDLVAVAGIGRSRTSTGA